MVDAPMATTKQSYAQRFASYMCGGEGLAPVEAFDAATALALLHARVTGAAVSIAPGGGTLHRANAVIEATHRALCLGAPAWSLERLLSEAGLCKAGESDGEYK
jgi:hypothetical protein